MDFTVYDLEHHNFAEKKKTDVVATVFVLQSFYASLCLSFDCRPDVYIGKECSLFIPDTVARPMSVTQDQLPQVTDIDCSIPLYT